MSKQFQFRINREEAGQRLDVFLASRLGQFSRMRIANLLAADACMVNQQAQKAGYHIAVDDLVEMTLDDSISTSMSAENIPLEVLYEDEQIIIVSKPAGMLVHPNKNTKSGTLANALAYHLNRLRIEPAKPQSEAIARHSADENHQQAERPGIDESAENPQSQTVVRPGLVHRLDRATSGLMVVAKTQKALSLLTKHFHKRLVKKLYLAVVEGCLQEDTGGIIAPIGHDESKKPPRWVMADGKHAETRFRVLERRLGATLVELEPVTGRTNQLRIHCAYIGHPIVGDTVYGSESGAISPESGVRVSDSGVETKSDEPPVIYQEDTRPDAPPTPDTGHPTIRLPVWTPDFPRLCLHAARLEFHHPVGGRWMEFQAALPKEIERIWDSFAIE
jgi:23S rRNA pseudouridine1911/1915/1917 synthase